MARMLLALSLVLVVLPVPALAAVTVDEGAQPGEVVARGDDSPDEITLTRSLSDVTIAADEAVTDAVAGDDCRDTGATVSCSIAALDLLTVAGLGGDDVLAGVSDFGWEVVLLGGGGGDALEHGYGPGLRLDGGAGDDTLDASGDLGVLGPEDAGGAGDDTYLGNDDYWDEVFDGPGADTYRLGEAPPSECEQPAAQCTEYDSVSFELGGPVVVTLDGIADDGPDGEDNVTPEVERVAGGAGDDRMDASMDDMPHGLFGYGGDDVLIGGASSDRLDGGEDSDHLIGNDGDDDLIDDLADWDDESSVDYGDDALDGGAGDDRLLTMFGADDVVGGPGWDTMDVAGFHPGAARSITLDGIADDGIVDPAYEELDARDNFHADIERWLLGGGDDRFTGSGNTEEVWAGPGDDTIDGGPGVDELRGETGEDAIVSRDGGFDLVNCGQGADPAVDADSGDRLDNCELSTITPLPDGGTVPPPATPSVAGSAIRMTLSGPTRVAGRTFIRRRRLSLAVEVDRDASISAEARVRGARIARVGDVIVGTRTLGLGDGERALSIRIARKHARALARRLRRGRAVRFTVVVTARDEAQRAATRTRKITVRPVPRRRR